MNKFLLTLFLILFAKFALAENLTPIEVVKIKDGDTIEAKIDKNKFPVRLIGIDCYETGKINRAYKQAYFNNLTIEEVVVRGKTSKEFLEKLYQNSNKNIYLDFRGLDIYKRALGVVYFDKLNVNEVMKEKGGCLIYDY